MTALVRIEAERVVADSRDVATEFGKRHGDVLRVITGLIKTQPEFERNFAFELYATNAGLGGERMAKRADVDRKGFMLLVMGFTGAKALELKSRWIDAFDEMERLLVQRESANDDESSSGMLPSLTEAGRICALGAVYHRIYGEAGAKWIMQMYGLPAPPVILATGPALPYLNNVTNWLEQCCLRDAHWQEEATELYVAYTAWCADQQEVAETQSCFGRSLGRLGFPPKKTNRVHRVGLRLIR